MEVDRPGPGEELNDGDETPARLASTVMVVRGGDARLEVLLVKRTEQARFMGGAWVFPGGAVDRGETEEEAALRELEEEAGIVIDDPGALVRFSRWITPVEVKIRYDTHFFLANVADDAEPTIDDNEIVDFGWFTPRAALDAYEREELLLVFPTIKHLEQLEPFGSATNLVARTRGREVVPIQPRVVMSGEIARVVLPGEPGYEET